MPERKNLNDDFNAILGDAKDDVKKVFDKASEFAKEAKDKANEFANEAKENTSKFTDDAKWVLEDGKNIAVIAHLTPIGWIIAFVMNSKDKKSEYASYYIRQMLGIMLFGFVIGFIPILKIVSLIFTLILWVMSLIGALSGEKKPALLLGEQFQVWFKSL